MDERIRGRIFIDGLELKDINQVFQRLFKINDQYGEQLEKDDWDLILEHTKSASLLIPPMNEQNDANETYYVVEKFADKYDCNVRKVIVKVEE